LKLKPGKVYLVVGYLGHKICTYVETNYPNVKMVCVHQQKTLGLGHAILLALKKFKKNTPALIILGDTIIADNLKSMLLKKSNCIAVKAVKDPKHYGIVEICGRKIKDMKEKPKKPKSNLAIVGAYYIKNSKKLKTALLQNQKSKIKTKGEFQLTDGLVTMLKQGEPFCFHEVKKWYDCGTEKSILQASKQLQKS
jgi:glucose-1-phosphate thymidylyltransferase